MSFFSRRRSLTALVLLALALPASTALAEDPPATSPTSATSMIVGKLASEAKQPLVNAKVIAFHLSTGEVFESSRSLSNGRYQILRLQPGYYDLAIETPAGLFVANQVVNVPPNGKAVANLQVVTSATGEAPRDFPGSDTPPQGIAQLLVKGGAFSSKKKLIWGGAAAVAGAALLGGSSSSGSVSP